MGQEPPRIVEGQRVLLEVEDPLGNTVLLFAPRWEAKIALDHPVTLDDVRETIADPDSVYEFKGDRRYYRRERRNKILFAVVRGYRGYDSIATLFPIDEIKNWPGEALIYVRKTPRKI